MAELPTFTVSFGLASSDQAPTFDEVVSLADAALLGAKAAGRDQIVVSPGPDLPASGNVSAGSDPTLPAIGDAIDVAFRQPQHN
jgi:hypothetical protein